MDLKGLTSKGRKGRREEKEKGSGDGRGGRERKRGGTLHPQLKNSFSAADLCSNSTQLNSTQVYWNTVAGGLKEIQQIKTHKPRQFKEYEKIASLTGILQKGDDLWEGFIHGLQSFLLTTWPAGSTDILRRACSNPHKLRSKSLIREWIYDRQIYVCRCTAVSVRHRWLAVSQSQYAEEIDRPGTVDAR